MTDYTSALDGVTQSELAACCGSGLYPRDQAVLTINEDGQVSVRVRTLYGGDGTPSRVWHRRTLEFSVRANADLDDLTETLGDDGAASALIDKIIAGHSVEWDGDNMVGSLDDEAETAADTLRQLLSEDVAESEWAAWDAAEWLYGGSHSAQSLLVALNVAPDASDEVVKEVVARLKAEAIRDNVVLTTDVEAVIREAIAKVTAENED